jgi:hypothetical protein
MSQDWKIRVQASDRTPYQFKAEMLMIGEAEAGAMEVSYLYGDGDLAVFLEDLGADVPVICGLIEELHGLRTAEIMVDVADEALEVLSRHHPEPGA